MAMVSQETQRGDPYMPEMQISILEHFKKIIPNSHFWHVMKMKYRMLDLFAGSHSVGNEFLKAGWEVDSVELREGQDVFSWLPVLPGMTY